MLSGGLHFAGLNRKDLEFPWRGIRTHAEKRVQTKLQMQKIKAPPKRSLNGAVKEPLSLPSKEWKPSPTATPAPCCDDGYS
jgi:hypothetical protein